MTEHELNPELFRLVSPLFRVREVGIEVGPVGSFNRIAQYGDGDGGCNKRGSRRHCCRLR